MLAPNVAANIPRNTPFGSFTSFTISLNPFINNLGYSKNLTIFMISFRSSFKNTDGVIGESKSEGRHNPKIYFWIAAYVAEAGAVNPKGTKMFLANSVSTLFINGKLTENWGFLNFRKPIFLKNYFFYFKNLLSLCDS